MTIRKRDVSVGNVVVDKNNESFEVIELGVGFVKVRDLQSNNDVFDVPTKKFTAWGRKVK